MVSKTLLVVALFALGLTTSLAFAADEPTPIVPTDGMKIAKDTVFVPGTYDLPNGVEITADGVTLDGNKAVLVGTDFKNVAVSAKGRKNITVKNVWAEHYRSGIRLEDCENPTLDRNNLTKTEEFPPLMTWTDVWITAENAYGAGILLIKVKGGKVSNNYLEHQQNGICMYFCNNMTIERNDASYSSGWGISMNESSDNIVQDNLADFCNRVHYRGGNGGDYVGADATGILIIKNSCRNKILRNMFREGGDGIFVAGFNGTCDDNLFEENDCSLSPNNAIESTFCKGNIFRKNRCNKSNYGLWLGYSWNNTITENEAVGNRVSGISIEHGNNNVISKNELRRNGQGILLWSHNPLREQENPVFAGMGESFNYTITDNNIYANRIGIYSITDGEGAEARCNKYTITGNTFTDNRTAIIFDRTSDSKITDNTMAGNVKDIKETNCTGNTIENNKTGNAQGDFDRVTLPF